MCQRFYKIMAMKSPLRKQNGENIYLSGPETHFFAYVQMSPHVKYKVGIKLCVNSPGIR